MPVIAELSPRCQDALSIFESGVESVLPRSMIERELKVSNDTLTVRGTSYTLNHNVYLVGFGKAVIGMVRAVEDIFGEHIVRGIAAIPDGLPDELRENKKYDMIPKQESKVKLYEAACNNAPDKISLEATEKVLHLAENLKSNHILIVLLSGGGGMLSAAPPDPITIEEYAKVGRILGDAGACNSDINTVRKHISRIKAGRLAKKAFPAKVISLILSDTMGNQLDMISGGPTSPNYGSAHASLNVIKKYGVSNVMPRSVMDYLQQETERIETERAWNEESQGQMILVDYNKGEHRDFDHVQNVLIGSNTIAVQAAERYAKNRGYVSFVMGDTLTGLSQNVGSYIGDLAFYALLLFDLKRTKISKDRRIIQVELDMIRKHKACKNMLIQLNTYIAEAYNTRKPLCIITSADADVKIHQAGKKGTGGPNQELVLSAAVVFDELIRKNELDTVYEVVLLSGDTDGRDGNSGAAGALTYSRMVNDATLSGLDVQKYIDNNDTHGFFSNFSAGEYAFYTGMTGTNVMDIQVLIIKLNYGILERANPPGESTA